MAGSYRVAVVGATGQVGRLMVALLRERNFPLAELVGFASERSAGRALEGAGTVRALSEEGVKGFALALFSAGSAVSGEWAPRFAEAGAVVVDNSSRWRLTEGIPLVVSEVNPEDLEQVRSQPWPGGIVANPNCSTMQMVVVLKPIHAAVGIERLTVATYQAVSGTGRGAVEELEHQARQLLQARAKGEEARLEARVYRRPIAFNVLPEAGRFPEGDNHTDEERKLMNETRKILGDQSLRISATCARVPVFVGHSEAVHLQTKRPLSAARARELLEAAPGLTVVDDPARGLYPTALEAAGQDGVVVGRIREDPGSARGLALWITADNLRKGAATNAVALAEELVRRGLLQRPQTVAA